MYAGFCTPFALRGGGQAPLNFFQGGGGFSTPEGASLVQISILKIIIFLMIFLSFFGTVYSYYVASLNDTN